MTEFQCPGCRTPLALGVDACVGCGAPIAWSYCGACLAANAPGALTCVQCGRSLQPSAHALPDAFPCPRCEGPMTRRELETFAVHECGRCRGAFVDHLTLRRLETEDAPPLGTEPARMARAQRSASPVVYIRCPGCSEVMNRVQFGRLSGIVVDVCKQHGTFFDPHELERAREFVSAGGLELAKKRQAEEEAALRKSKKGGTARKKSGHSIQAPVVTSDAAMLAIARAIAQWLRVK